MYNTPILTPEDGVKQPIDTSDDYPGAYGTPANDPICDPKFYYWIDNGGIMYKGPFPNKEEVIMTCSREFTTGVYCPIDEFVFRDKGIVLAELRCEKEDTLERRITLSLRSQQKELGVVYRRHDIDLVTYSPFFLLTCARIDLRSPIIIYPLVLAVFLGISGIMFLLVLWTILGLLVIAILIGICIAYRCHVYHCCKFCMKNEVRRLHTYNVNDINTIKVVAKVYTLRKDRHGLSDGTELSCRREMTRSQLMGLFSLIMLSGRIICPRPPDPVVPYDII